MTIDEAIKHAEEVAEEQDKLCKQYDDASRYARSHNKDIVSANAKKCLECFECAKEHRQLAEWLKDYKRLKEQEPKPMVEIDLYSVIKQKYIEREVLDKIRAEIEKEIDRDNHADEYCDGYYDGMKDALAIIDKYKSEIPTGSTTKNNLAHSLCDSCTNIECLFQSGIVRKECAFYMPPRIQADNCGKYVVQDSTTKNDLGVDSILRNTVLTLINDVKNANGFSDYSQYEYLFDQVDKMPSVNPQEPKTGHWIYDKSIANWICSKCGETPKTMGYVGTDTFMAEHFKYCNHCGAKMAESENKG